MQRTLYVLLVFGAALATFAGFAAGQQAVPKGRTIELTIVATGKDEAPVQDLKAEDLTIKDDNKKQDIVSFEKLAAGTAAAPGTPALHNFVLIDCLNSPFMDAPENRLAMLKILNELGKADNVTLLMLRQDLKVVADASQGADSLIGKIAQQGFDPSKAQAFNWVFTGEQALGQLFAPVLVNSQRARMEAWLHWLQIITSNIQARRGRRNLFWISQYFPPLIMGETGAGYLEQAATGNGGGSSKKGGAATPTTDESAELLTSYAKDIHDTARAIQNAGMAIYPLDARSLTRNSQVMADKARMQDMAKATGGLSFASPKDLAAAVHDAIADTQTVYIARYAMSDPMFNGKDHAIKIETKRKDVKLRARDGYFAPNLK